MRFCRCAWHHRIGTTPARTNRTLSLFFFLMKHEPADGKVLGSSTFGLCDDMRAVESRSTEPQGGNKIPCSMSTELKLNRRRLKRSGGATAREGGWGGPI